MPRVAAQREVARSTAAHLMPQHIQALEELLKPRDPWRELLGGRLQPVVQQATEPRVATLLPGLRDFVRPARWIGRTALSIDVGRRESGGRPNDDHVEPRHRAEWLD